MKLKPIVTALCVVSLATAGSAFAASKDANLQMRVDQLAKQVNALSQGGHSFVQTNSAFAKSLTNNQRDVKDVARLIHARDNGLMANTLYVGGKVEADATYSRYKVTLAGSDATATGTNIDLQDARLTFTPVLNNWATGYISLQSSGSTVSVDDALLVLGNLNQMPVYGFVGKGLVNFGQFASVNTLINPLNRSLFAQAANQLGFGFDMSGFNASFTWLNGLNKSGSTVNSINPQSGEVTASTTVTNSNIANNFAVDANYGMKTGQVDWRIGGGYINDTQYKTNKSDNAAERNGAWDIYGHMTFASFKLLAEYTQTLNPAITPMTVTGNVNGNTAFVTGNNAGTYKLSSWQVAGQYDMPLMGRDTQFGLSYSQGKMGSDYKQYQIVASARHETFSNVWLGLSYAYANTSGDNFVVSKTDATSIDTSSNTVLLDATAYF